VPNLLGPVPATPAPDLRRTAARFGYLWGRYERPPIVEEPVPFHVEKLARALGLILPEGLTLDAGCGDGVDLANVARRPGPEVIGVELSAGGARTSWPRTARLRSAHWSAPTCGPFPSPRSPSTLPIPTESCTT
jgi:SAM-dependent methyltransferase